MGYTERIEFHKGYPNVLGETAILDVACPPLTLHAIDGDPAKVAFDSLQPEEFNVAFDVVLVALGQWEGPSGKFTVVNADNGEITWGKGGAPGALRDIRTFRLTEAIQPGEYLVKADIDAETAAKILTLEREHKDDAEYAYGETIEHLAAAVNALKDKVFSGADEAGARRAALQELAKEVGEQFVPAYPMVLGNWSILARQHCKALADQSKKRDRREGTHHLSWTAQVSRLPQDRVPGVLRLVPVVPEVRQEPSEVLKLDELPVVTPNWDAEAPPSCPFAPGEAVVVQTDLKLPGIPEPPRAGWRGTFLSDNSDALGSQFVFLLYAPGHDPDNEETFTVPPDQLGSLRPADPPAAPSAPPPAPVSYSNPFKANEQVKATRVILTKKGEIPADAVGEFVEDVVTPTGVEHWFSFPSVQDTGGGKMFNVMIGSAYLADGLERYGENLSPNATATAQPALTGDTGTDNSVLHLVMQAVSEEPLPDDPDELAAYLEANLGAAAAMLKTGTDSEESGWVSDLDDM